MINPVLPPAEWLLQPSQGFLTDLEHAQVRCLFDRILPEDAQRQLPGATQAGAADFVSLLLARSAATYWEIPAWQDLYRTALPLLDQWSQATHQVPLVALQPAQIDGLIRGLEAGALLHTPLPPPKQILLFRTFLRHTIQGCFGDPRWGGNKNKIMWRAIGYLQQPETAAQIQQDQLPILPL